MEIVSTPTAMTAKPSSVNCSIWQMGWPADGKLNIKSLASAAGKITDFTILGSGEKTMWGQSSDALEVKLPATPVSPYVIAPKIHGNSLKPEIPPRQ